MRALWRNDGRHAAPAQAFAPLVVWRYFRDLILGQPARGIDHEAAGLKGMVPHRDFDLIGEYLANHRSRELPNVDFLMLRH